MKTLFVVLDFYTILFLYYISHLLLQKSFYAFERNIGKVFNDAKNNKKRFLIYNLPGGNFFGMVIYGSCIVNLLLSRQSNYMAIEIEELNAFKKT